MVLNYLLAVFLIFNISRYSVYLVTGEVTVYYTVMLVLNVLIFVMMCIYRKQLFQQQRTEST